MLVSDFDTRTLRSVLGTFATGVAVVTAVTEGRERLGLTVSSFNSVSLTPPLVLFSVARSARAFEEWRRARRYMINILGEEHQHVSNRFGRASEDKFDGIDLTPCDGGLMLDDAVACLDCEPYNRYDGGDHEIFVGRVVAISHPAQIAARPLLFYGGRYRRIDPETARDAA